MPTLYFGFLPFPLGGEVLPTFAPPPAASLATLGLGPSWNQNASTSHPSSYPATPNHLHLPNHPILESNHIHITSIQLSIYPFSPHHPFIYSLIPSWNTNTFMSHPSSYLSIHTSPPLQLRSTHPIQKPQHIRVISFKLSLFIHT